MYATSTFVLRMPANRDTATITGTGAPAAMTSEAPMPTAPRSITRPTGLNAKCAATTEPASDPTANADSTRPTTPAPRSRSIVR